MKIFSKTNESGGCKVLCLGLEGHESRLVEVNLLRQGWDVRIESSLEPMLQATNWIPAVIIVDMTEAEAASFRCQLAETDAGEPSRFAQTKVINPKTCKSGDWSSFDDLLPPSAAAVVTPSRYN